MDHISRKFKRLLPVLEEGLKVNDYWDIFKKTIKELNPDKLEKNEIIDLYYISYEHFGNYFNFSFYFHQIKNESGDFMDENYQVTFDFKLEQETQKEDFEEFQGYLDDCLKQVEETKTFDYFKNKKLTCRVSYGSP